MTRKEYIAEAVKTFVVLEGFTIEGAVRDAIILANELESKRCAPWLSDKAFGDFEPLSDEVGATLVQDVDFGYGNRNRILIAAEVMNIRTLRDMHGSRKSEWLSLPRFGLATFSYMREAVEPMGVRFGP